MEKLDIVPTDVTVTKVMILNFEKDCDALVQQSASLLRRAGIPTEIYLGQETGIKAQLSFAVKQNIPFVVIIGGEEKKAGTAVVKDLRKRKQSVVPFAGIVDALAALV